MCKYQGRKECRGTKCSNRQFDKVSALKGELSFKSLRYDRCDLSYLVCELLGECIPETAMLLPGKYARRYMMHSASKYEVRSNLKTFNREEKEK